MLIKSQPSSTIPSLENRCLLNNKTIPSSSSNSSQSSKRFNSHHSKTYSFSSMKRSNSNSKCLNSPSHLLRNSSSHTSHHPKCKKCLHNSKCTKTNTKNSKTLFKMTSLEDSGLDQACRLRITMCMWRTSPMWVSMELRMICLETST